MNKKVLFLFFLALALLPLNSYAMREDTSLIDTPSASILPVRTFGVNARVFTGGGVLTYFDFAVLNRLSIGASFTFEHLIGTNDEDIKVLVPSLQLKFRFYDGSDILPAFAIGFDNQGFDYDHDKDEYLQKSKGLYLVATKELFIPGLIINPGINVTAENFEFDSFAGFLGVSLNIKDVVSLMFEWDNIHSFDESRLNGGIRVYVTDAFNMDFAIRDFNHKAERIAQLKYTGNF